MNPQQNALDRVTLQARDYFSLKEDVEVQRQRMVTAIKEAAELDNTQQKIADACHIDDTKKISRQRVAQIIQEKP